MGQAPPRRTTYHTQEIALVPRSVDEWQTLGRWTTTAEVEGPEADGGTRGCKAALVPPCCATDDGACSVEEVIVVHHDALRKVNFLLKVDELSGCELPAVPECVVAARRAELRKRQELALQDAAALMAAGRLPGLPAGAAAGGGGSGGSPGGGEPEGGDGDEERLEPAMLAAASSAASIAAGVAAGPGRTGRGLSWIPPPRDLDQDVSEPCLSRDVAPPPPPPPAGCPSAAAAPAAASDGGAGCASSSAGAKRVTGPLGREDIAGVDSASEE